MARNVAEAAKGAGDIAQNVTNVGEVAQATSAGASKTQRAATDLARMNTELQQTVARFSFDAVPLPFGGALAALPVESSVRRAAGERVRASA